MSQQLGILLAKLLKTKVQHRYVELKLSVNKVIIKALFGYKFLMSA